MKQIDFDKLMAYAHAFTGYTPEREAPLTKTGKDLSPCLGEVVDAFYTILQNIDETEPFLEDRIENMKKIRPQSLLTSPHNMQYTKTMHQAGSSMQALNTVPGFITLMVMQESCQASSLGEELKTFLAVTGMSRTLFNNLAEAYKA